MKETKIEELIDGHLRQKLSAEEHTQLQEMLMADPALKVLISESEEAYRYILHHKYKGIRNQLKEFDKNELQPTKSFRLKKWGICFGVFALFSILSLLTLSYSFQPSLIAKRYLEDVHIENISSMSAEVANNFIAAKRALHENDFQNAAGLFLALKDDKTEEVYEKARWNYLMCYLAIEGPASLWKNEMNIFIASADEHYKVKADKILRLYHSPLYRLVRKFSKAELSSLQPRLI